MKLRKEIKTIIITVLIAAAVCGYVKLYTDRIEAIENGTMPIQNQHEK